MTHQYYSTTTRFVSTPSPGSKIHGSTNTVSIKNGKGYKLKENLDKSGKVIQRTRKNLSKKEIATVVKGKFLPGFWRNCNRTVKNCRRA